MNDPDQARRLTEERITKLEKDKEQAERMAEESRKNEENAKRLAEEERLKAEESKRNAVEEKRRRLEVEAELQKLRARLEVHGQA